MGNHLPGNMGRGKDDPASRIVIEEYENEVIIDCRGLAKLDDPPDVRVKNDTGGSIGLEKVAPIRDVSADNISYFRYNSATKFDDELPDSVRRVYDDKDTFPIQPIVHEVDDGYELVDGHVRVNAFREYDIDEIPVHVLDIDEREAMEFWANAHFPHPDDEYCEEIGLYAPELQRKALRALLRDWSTDELKTNERLRYAIERHLE